VVYVVQLYGLFKLLTVAPSPNTNRPSFIDISGRAKWDAWKLAAGTYEGRPSEAEHRYLEIARSLGWKEGCPSTVTASTAAVTDETEEPDERSSGGGTGMGVSVSVMSQPPEDEPAVGLHGCAMGDDVAALSAFLQASQDLDIDARDEYVSILGHFAATKMVFISTICRATPRCTWLQIEGTWPRSSFCSSTVPIKHSK
jgi:acyl-CoA-binding protein